MRRQWPVASLGLGWLLLVVLACLAAAPASRADETAEAGALLRVALLDLATDDGTYDGIMAGAGLAAAAQAALMVETPRVWVERQDLDAARRELGLSAMGLSGPASAVRLGKWLKADLLVTGGFRQETNGIRNLRLEVVDLVRAELLADAVLPWKPGPIDVGSEDVERTVNSLRTLLQTAGQRRAEIAGQTVVAPLFFRNTSRERRLDFFEYDLQEALAAAAATAQVHILRFPHAAEAYLESELAVRGLTESSPDAWGRVADSYVWGTFTERETYGVPFDEVEVDATIEIWNGRDAPSTVTGNGKTGQLAALAACLAQKIMAALGPRGDNQAGEAIRREMGEKLLAQARQVRDPYINPHVFGTLDYGATPEGRRAWAQALQLLEAACFFMPDNAVAHRERLMTRCHMSVRNVTERFPKQLAMCREFGEFVEHFGPGALDEPSDIILKQWSQARSKGYSDVRSMYVTSVDAALAWFGQEYFGFARGMPVDKQAAWRRELEAEYVKRHILARDTSSLANCYGLVKDSMLRVELVEALWPYVFTPKPYDAVIRKDRRELEDMVRKIYVEAGIPEQAERLLEHGQASPAAKGDDRYAGIPEEKRFEVPRLFFLPPEAGLAWRIPAWLPDCARITALTLHGGRLWISAQGPANSTYWSGSMLDFLYDGYRTSSVWSVALDDGDMVNVSASLGIVPRIFAFLPNDDGMWMAAGPDGLWRVDPGTFTGRAFGLREGLLSSRIYSLAKVRDRVFAGGGTHYEGKLCTLESGRTFWAALDTGACMKDETGPFTCVRRLAGFGDWLLVDGGRGAPWLLCVPTGMWKTQPDVTELVASVADDEGFWIGTKYGLARMDPRIGEAEKHFSPAGPFLYDQVGHFPRKRSKGLVRPAFLPLSRIPGGVSALHDDGEWLWVAATTDNGTRFLPGPEDGHRLMLWHKPSARWVAHARLPARATCMAGSEDRLWVGLLEPASTGDRNGKGCRALLEVDKTAWRRIPEDRWFTDEVTPEMLERALAALPRREQARYAFLLEDYARAVSLLKDEPRDIDSLFMLAYSYDPKGLNQPDKARACFQELVDRHASSLWVKEARRQIELISLAP